MFNSSTFNSRLFNSPITFGAVSMSGTGNMAVDGERLEGANVFMVGTGNMSVAGQVIRNVKVGFSGTGNMTINGGKLQIATVNMIGVGNMTIQPLKVLFGSVSFLGTGTVQIEALRVRTLDEIIFAGTGDMTVQGVSSYFFVSRDGILKPLGVFVLRDSRYDLLPGTRENTEQIPGRHGEIDFGSEFLPRIIEMEVITSEFDFVQREQIKRELAKHLNPLGRAKSLVFADDIEKTYYVKFAGKIDYTLHPNQVRFTIPFKSSNPFIIGTFIKTHTGSGILTNEGTVETPLVIEITGTVTNPSVTIGGQTLTYTGTLGSSDKLVIDTETMTVKFNGVNALANYSGGFPKLQPGDTEVIAASGGTTVFKWYDRWV